MHHLYLSVEVDKVAAIRISLKVVVRNQNVHKLLLVLPVPPPASAWQVTTFTDKLIITVDSSPSDTIQNHTLQLLQPSDFTCTTLSLPSLALGISTTDLSSSWLPVLMLGSAASSSSQTARSSGHQEYCLLAPENLQDHRYSSSLMYGLCSELGAEVKDSIVQKNE